MLSASKHLQGLREPYAKSPVTESCELTMIQTWKYVIFASQASELVSGTRRLSVDLRTIPL